MKQQIQFSAAGLALVLALSACGEKNVSEKSEAAHHHSHSNSGQTVASIAKGQQVRGKPSLNAQLRESEFIVPVNLYTDIELQFVLPQAESRLNVSLTNTPSVEIEGELDQRLVATNTLITLPIRLRVKEPGRHYLNVFIELPDSSGLSKRPFVVALAAGDDASERQLKTQSASQKVVLPAQETVY